MVVVCQRIDFRIIDLPFLSTVIHGQTTHAIDIIMYLSWNSSHWTPNHLQLWTTSRRSCVRGRSSSVPSGEEGIPSNKRFPATYQSDNPSGWCKECNLVKKARPVREDHLERQETAEELRERIRVLFKLEHTPDDKHVKFLLSRLEKYKRTGYV